MKSRYKLDGAAEELSISKAQVEKLLAEGKLKAHQDTPGGDRYISHHAIQEYIEAQEAIPVLGKRRTA